MKINWFLFCIAFAIAGLIAYGFFAGNIDSQYRIVIVAGTFLSCFVPLAGLLALKLDVRGGLNVRVLSLLFVIGALVVNIVFTVKVKAWHLQILKIAFGDAIVEDTSKIKEMIAVVPPDVFANVGVFSLTPYIIVTGILILLYLLAAYGLVKALREAR
jgi:hypothetical protein